MAAGRQLTCSACGQNFATPSAGAEATCPGCGATTPLTALATRVGLTETSAGGLVGTRVGGFQLEEFLGAGGMGAVFAARRLPEADIECPPRVALKLLAQDLCHNPDFVARFTRESAALTRIDHPNLIRVFGSATVSDEGPHFYVMECFDGQDLQAILRDGQPNLEEARCILVGAARGLAHAHKQGLVHRDVKPANILVAGEVASGGDVKVVDFGVAQWAPLESRLTSLTRSDHLLGTLNYMAPEQRQSAEAVDGRADVYALAVVAYEMLTGRLPLGVFERPSQLRPELPRRVDAVLWAALHRDPARRTPTMEAFAAALESALAPRRRGAWLMAAAAAAAVVAAFVVVQNFASQPKSKAGKEKVSSAQSTAVKKAPPPAKTPEAPPQLEPGPAERLAAVMIKEAQRVRTLAQEKPSLKTKSSLKSSKAFKPKSTGKRVGKDRAIKKKKPKIRSKANTPRLNVPSIEAIVGDDSDAAGEEAAAPAKD